MGGKLLACSECSRSCLTIHKNKRDPDPIVVSFFKIMFGNQFSEVLIVPPKFAKTIMELNGKNTYLEDSTGQKWEVNLSNLDGSLVFQKGWHEFSVDHDIRLGDLLVFNYFKGSHFNVQIFGRSGCEKPMIFGGKDYQNNRAKVTRDCVPRSDPWDSPRTDLLANESLYSFMDNGPDDVDVIQRKKHVVNVRKSSEIGVNDPIQKKPIKRPKVDPTTDLLVESYFMTNRNASSEDDRDNTLFDLSVFEIPKKEVLRGNRCSPESSALQITQVAEDGEDWFGEEYELLPIKTISRVDVPLDVSMPVKSIDFPHTSEFSAPITSDELPCERKRIVQQESNSDANVAIVDNISSDSIILSTTKHHTRFARKSKSTLLEEDKGQRDMIVNLNFCDSPSLDVKTTCLVKQDSDSFLELPKALPVQVRTVGDNSEEKLVLLRDPVRRIWPVIYQQREGVFVLARGWEKFKKSNSIQSGDECTFVVENINESILQVQICRSCRD